MREISFDQGSITTIFKSRNIKNIFQRPSDLLQHIHQKFVNEFQLLERYKSPIVK